MTFTSQGAAVIIGLLVQLNYLILLVALGLLCLPGAWLWWLIAQHLRHRRRGLAMEAAFRRQAWPAGDQLPHVLVQVPTFNESWVIRRIIDAVGALDWPRDKLHIQVLDDSTDETTRIARDAVAALRARAIDAIVLHRAARSDFKAGALRDGLRHSTDPYVAIFDADFVPAPDFLRLCLQPLLGDPRLAFVQTRWDHLNADDNALTRAQHLILDAHFAVEQTAKNWSGHITHFGGSCGVWRRAAIDDAGGWSADTLVEDVDLSYRVQLRGWRALFLVTVAVPGELPDTIAAWRAQQARWTKGFGQLAHRHLAAIWRSDLSGGRKAVASANLLVTAFGPLVAVAVASAMIQLLVGGPINLAVALATIAALMGGVAAAVMVLLGQDLLHGTRPRAALPRIAALAVFFVYAHVMAAKGVLHGLGGRSSAFVRTPKKGVGAEGAVDDALPSPNAAVPADRPARPN